MGMEMGMGMDWDMVGNGCGIGIGTGTYLTPPKKVGTLQTFLSRTCLVYFEQ